MEEAQMATATDTTQTPVAAQHTAEFDHSLPDAAVVLKLRNVDAFYGSRRVVRDISLDVARNAITAIIGPSEAASPRYCVASTECTKWYLTLARPA